MNVDEKNNIKQRAKISERCGEPNHDIFYDHAASRVCKRCHILVCGECVIEFHEEHIKETCKIEDHLQQGKEDYSNFVLKAEIRVNNCAFVKALGEERSELKKMVEDTVSLNEKNIQVIEGKLENLRDTNKRIKNKLITDIDQEAEKIVNNENYKKIIKEKNTHKEIVSSWSSLNIQERLNIIKSKGLIESEFFREVEALDKEMYSLGRNHNTNPNTNNNANQNQSNVFDQEGTKMYYIEVIAKMSTISLKEELESNISQKQMVFNKAMLALEKGECEKESNNTNFAFSYEDDLNMLRNDYNHNGNFKDTIILNHNMPENNLNQITTKLKSHLNIPSMPNSPTKEQPYQPPRPSNIVNIPISVINIPIPIPNITLNNASNNLDFSYLISLKTSSTTKSEVFVVFTDLKKDAEGYMRIKLEDSHFESKPLFNFPAEYSKSVNIGDSILISGGQDQNKQIDNCFILKISNDLSNYKVKIRNFPKMNAKRERHNVIFLRNRGMILACGGFYTKTSEVCEVEGEWRHLPTMKNERTNATMMYYKNRYVYCIGGFEMIRDNKGQNNGAYLGSCEYLDMNKTENGWSFINLDSLFKINFGLCAMGVIDLTPNKFLLVGGFDGNKYLNECHEIIFDQNDRFKELTTVKLNGLGKGVLFYHSKFTQIGSTGKFLNHDMQGKLFIYDQEKNSFNIKMSP